MEKWEQEIKEQNFRKAIDLGLGFDKPFEEYIQKGGKATIGEIHTWGGKKYKKVAEGKWQEISESHGMTKKKRDTIGKEFTETSPIMMTTTSRATYTSGDPSETTLKNLKEGGWDISDDDFEKIKRGETVTHYSPNGMNKISVSQKK